jgi:hypothetical protein
MRYPFLFLAALTALYAAPADLTIMRSTAQQIVISYRVPQDQTCTLEASENPSFSPVVHDVNGALFSGAESDLSRAGTHVNGDFRVVVIGKRIVERASDGRRYSRSLQALTPHYIRVRCGGEATATATTENIPFGPTSDAPPAAAEPGAEGQYGFATSNPFDRSETIIDHTTGALIKKVSLPMDSVDNAYITGTLGTPIGDNWTNPTGVSTASDGIIAEYSGASGEPLFIPNTKFFPGASYELYRLNLDLRAEITGGAIGGDALAGVCIGTAQRCVSDWKEIDLTTCRLDSVQGQCQMFGDATPYSGFWWKNGEFPVEGWWMPNSGLGLRIRKMSGNTAHTLRIDSIAYRGISTEMAGTNTWSPKFCSENYVTENGRDYALCHLYDRFAHFPKIYSIDVESGEAHYLGPVHLQYGVNGSAESRSPSPVAWDGTNPRVFYTPSILSNFQSRVYRCEIAATPGLMTRDWSFSRTTQPSFLTCTNMTPTGYTLTDQVRAMHPDFSPEWVALVNSVATRGWTFQMSQKGRLIFRAAVQQDLGAWVLVFDPTAAPPAGCSGCSGRVIAASSMGASAVPQERKFCGLHTVFNSPFPDWAYFAGARQHKAQNAQPWAGPWSIQIKRPGCNPDAEDCSISATDTVFEVIPQNGSYDWVDAVPGSTNDGVLPLVPGDLMIYSSGSTLQWTPGSEYMEVLEVNSSSRTIRVRRGPSILTSPWIAGSGWDSNPYMQNTAVKLPKDAMLYGICRATAVNYDYNFSLAWNFIADPLGKTYVQPATNGVGTFPPAPGTYPAASGYASPNLHHMWNFGGHGTFALGDWVQALYKHCPKHYSSTLNTCYSAQTDPDNVNVLNSAVSVTVAYNPPFAGKWATPASYQTHVTREQSRAFNNDADYMLDVQPLMSASQANTLVPDTATVYKLTGVTLNRKQFGTLAFVGDRILTDISGPGSVIDDSRPFTYCVALKAGECRPDSAVNDIYASTPLRNAGTCSTPASTYPITTYAPCVIDRAPYTIGPVQVSLTRNDPVGERTRLLANYRIRPYTQTAFTVANALPSGKWALYLTSDAAHTGFNILKLPPLPESQAFNPLTFERVSIEIGAAPANTADVLVDFGYVEHGAPDQFRCTSRAETCTVATVNVNDADPFRFTSEVSGGIPWSDGLRVDLPRIPGRVMYARIRFRDAGGNLVGVRDLPPL